MYRSLSTSIYLGCDSISYLHLHILSISRHDITKEVMLICENGTFFKSENHGTQHCVLADYRVIFRMLCASGGFLAFITECVGIIIVCAKDHKGMYTGVSLTI